MLSKLNRSAARDHTEDHRLCKPRQVREHPKVEASIHEYFDRSGRKELDFALATKADGQNGYLRLTERPVQLWKRQGTRPAMEIPRFERFLTREALDGLRAELGVEITAWLVRPGRPDVELGHAWVDRAMKAFVQNGYENKGKLHMRLRIFRLVGNYAPASCLRDLKELVVPCNGVLDVVPLERCLVRRAGGRALQYFMWLPGNVRQFAGHDMEQFIQFALRQAAPLGIEGYVACFPEDALRRPDEWVPFKHDSLGTPRARCLLKVKLEPTGRVVAVKVDNAEASEVWLFAKPEDPKMHAAQLLRYAGNASDNPILQGFLEGKLAPLTYETPEEKRVLYQPKRLMDLAPGAVIVHVTSAAITPRDLLTGIKIYGTRRAETNDRYRITPDDYLDALDPIEPIARALPHLMSVRAGIEALKQEEGLQLGEEDAVEDPLPRPDLKRKQREYSPKWVTHERFPSHERENLPEPEEEEEEDDESRQYSPLRQHSPEPEEEEDDESRQYSPLRQHSPEPQEDDDCPASLPY